MPLPAEEQSPAADAAVRSGRGLTGAEETERIVRRVVGDVFIDVGQAPVAGGTPRVRKGGRIVVRKLH